MEVQIQRHSSFRLNEKGFITDYIVGDKICLHVSVVFYNYEKNPIIAGVVSNLTDLINVLSVSSNGGTKEVVPKASESVLQELLISGKFRGWSHYFM